MFRAIVFQIICTLISGNIYAQLYRDNILTLKGNYKYQQDTSSLDYLKKCKNIPNLIVNLRDSYEHENLQIFKHAPLVTRLSIHSHSIKSLSGLEHLQKLKALTIHKNSIEDFSAINSANEIEELCIDSRTEIQEPLRLEKLKWLNFTCNYEIGKCDFPNLKEIYIRQFIAEDRDYDDNNYGIIFKRQEPCCPIDLSSINSLESILLYDAQFYNLSDIKIPSQIKSITLNNCLNLRKVDNVENYSSLKTLNIYHCNQIADFSFLADLENATWRVRHMGRLYTNGELRELLEVPKDQYFYADGYENEHSTDDFYNFHTSVIENAKPIFEKYHKLFISSSISKQEFLDLIPKIIKELDQLCTGHTCNIEWNDEESDILIDFLTDMAQLAGHEFTDSHLYRRFEY